MDGSREIIITVLTEFGFFSVANGQCDHFPQAMIMATTQRKIKIKVQDSDSLSNYFS